MKSIDLELVKAKAEAKMIIDADETESFLLVTSDTLKVYASDIELLTFITEAISSLAKNNDLVDENDILSIIKLALNK